MLIVDKNGEVLAIDDRVSFRIRRSSVGASQPMVFGYGVVEMVDTQSRKLWIRQDMIEPEEGEDDHEPDEDEAIRWEIQLEYDENLLTWGFSGEDEVEKLE